MVQRDVDPQQASDAALRGLAERWEATAQRCEAAAQKSKAELVWDRRARAGVTESAEAKSAGERCGGATLADYDDLLVLTLRVVQMVKEEGRGFVSRRGLRGFHILFDESEVSRYFDEIREGMRRSGGPSPAVARFRGVGAASSNREIWEALVHSLELSGVDFEHAYKIVPADAPEPAGTLGYSFAEGIVLSHTLLLVPVMQHYAPLVPKLDLGGPTAKLDAAQPLLAVGMVGDCLKGSVFEEITRRAERGDEVAAEQRDTLRDPRRLQQKLRGLVRALLAACRLYPPRQGREPRRMRLRLDAVLVGAGAFGGDPRVLAQPFADSLGGGGLPFAGDDVSFFIFPPPAPEHLSLGPSLGYATSLNPKRGLGAALSPAPGEECVLRVLVAGFDPVSLAPHGVAYRAFSAEGQLCHATDILERLAGAPGAFVPVRVPPGRAWESPAAFFASPQVLKTKGEEGYDTVRFVPRSVLEGLGAGAGRGLQLREKGAARVWNGDSFEGWALQLADGTPGGSWRDVLGR